MVDALQAIYPPLLRWARKLQPLAKREDLGRLDCAPLLQANGALRVTSDAPHVRLVLERLGAITRVVEIPDHQMPRTPRRPARLRRPPSPARCVWATPSFAPIAP